MYLENIDDHQISEILLTMNKILCYIIDPIYFTISIISILTTNIVSYN